MDKEKMDRISELTRLSRERELTPDELRQMFHIIHVDWNTGET